MRKSAVRGTDATVSGNKTEVTASSPRSLQSQKRLEFLAFELLSEAAQPFELGRVEKVELLRAVEIFEAKIVQ